MRIAHRAPRRTGFPRNSPSHRNRRRSLRGVALIDEHVVVLITGVPASGKSTVSAALARRFERGVHVRGDAFRRMVVAGREEMTANPSDEAWRQLRLRYRLGASTADAYFDDGFSVVVQDVVVGAVLEEYVHSIRSRPLVVAVLAPSVDAIARREAARDKTAYRDEMDGIAAMDRSLREDTPRIGLWLDTSDLGVDETVDAIVARGLTEGRVE
jgi:cytidylate kinase